MTGDLFDHHHYNDAIFAACRGVEVRVRLQSGLSGQGQDLMARAFAYPNGPIQLAHEVGQSGRDEQEGFRLMFMGLMTGIRNPKGHELDRKLISEKRTVDYLSIAGLLMRRLDDALFRLREASPDAAEQVVSRIEEAAPGSVPGRIEGIVGYPSSHVPALRVYALTHWRHVAGYVLESPPSSRRMPLLFDEAIPGIYHVVAYRADGHPGAGGYAQFVLDGLRAGYKDHSLLDVTVFPGEVTSGVEVTDWYAADTFPAEPKEVRPAMVDALAKASD